VVSMMNMGLRWVLVAPLLGVSFGIIERAEFYFKETVS
jgi:hypothetical protein